MAQFGGQSQQRWGDNTLNANEHMRDLMLTDLSGKPVQTADARRKGMLALAFFAPSDPDSAAVLTCLQRLADAYKDSGKVTVLAVSEEGEDATRAFGKQNGIGFPLMLDRDGYHAMVYGVTDLPVVYLADGSGVILRRAVRYKPTALNEMSARVAAFAEVAAVDIVNEPTATAPVS